MTDKKTARESAGQAINSHHNNTLIVRRNVSNNYLDAPSQFRQAIIDAGLTPPEVIESDAVLHRFASNGTRRDQAGWYVFYADGVPAGKFGCWRTGMSQPWRADIGRALTADELAQHRARMNAVKDMRERAEREQRAEAAERAAQLVAATSPAPTDHPYLVRKGIAANGLLVGADGRLLIPMHDSTGALSSLQFIDAEGDKRFLTGGRVKGCSYTIGEPGETVCIAEGFATSAAIHAATGHAVVVAFTAGNLEAVATDCRKKWPKSRLVVCADDDAVTVGNPGRTKATAAARAIGGLLAVPDFGLERPERATDFDDLLQHRGADSVLACITAAKAPDKEPWAEALPLIDESVSAPYPLDALPGAIGDAVREVVDFVQCPPAMAACSALSSLSVAAQGLVNVSRGPDLIGPISVFTLTVADSGERKSECDKRFSEALRQWERDQLKLIAPDLANSRADHAAWEQERDAVRANIKKARAKGESTEEARKELAELEEGKPRSVREPRLLLESETAENLAWTLGRPDGWPSAGLLSSEAGVIFGGHSMRPDSIMQSLAILNKFWSDELLRVGRRTSESFEVDGARLTMGLAVQPEAVQTFFEKSQGLARGTGFLARFLFAWPGSTQGTRLYRDGPRHWPGLQAYQSRLRSFLEIPLKFDESDRLSPMLLAMQPEAFEIWRAFYDGVEREQSVLGELFDLRDVASKAADNCARVAALFHVLQHGPIGTIAAQDVAAAARIVTWHLAEAKRFLGELSLPLTISNAAKLEFWLIAVCHRQNVAAVAMRDVMNRGPNPVRRKEALQAALKELIDANRVRLTQDGRTIEINPALLER
mgnify:CR=1 FL=1